MINVNLEGLFKGCFKIRKKEVLKLDDSIIDLIENSETTKEHKLKFLLVKLINDNGCSFGAINSFSTELKNIASVGMQLNESAQYIVKSFPIIKKDVLIGNVLLGTRKRGCFPLLDQKIYNIIKKLL